MSRERMSDIKIVKSLSMPLSTVERIVDETFNTGQSFSATTILLVNIGLSVRKAARLEDEAESRGTLAKSKKAKQVDVGGTVVD